MEPIRERLGLEPTDHVITYCSRGLESMRGFDVFMRTARRVYEADKDARFVVVGSDSVSYGGALRFTGGRSFREHVLAEHDYDLTRFRFLGRVEPSELVQIFSVSDLHVYLTVPFVLSRSMLNAMACGCTVVGSDTAPVRELIEHDVNGALCDFFDDTALAHSMRELLAQPERRAPGP